MAKHSEVFDLIKSLTKSEKRYFKLHASLHTKGEINNYVQLFDLLEHQQEYNEEEIRSMFEKHCSGTRLSDASQYLYQNILKTLYLFHMDHPVGSQIHVMAQQAELLFHKKLYRQAGKVLDKAKELSVHHEYFFDTIEILLLKEHFQLTHSHGDSEVAISSLYREISDSFRQAAEFLEYCQLQSRMFNEVRRVGIPRRSEQLTEIISIISHEAMRRDPAELSLSARMYYHLIYAVYYKTVLQYEKSLEHHKIILHLIETNKTTQNKFGRTSKRFTASLYNICLTCISAQNKEDFFHYHARLMEVSEKNPEKERYRTYVQALSLSANFFIIYGEFEQAAVSLREVEEAMQRFRGKFMTGFEYYVYFMGFNTCFGLQRYSQSLDYLNSILEQRATEIIKRDIYYMARLVLLIVHFELQNFDLLEYLLKSTYKFFLSRSHIYGFETVILTFIRKVLRNGGDPVNEFSALYEELLRIRDDPFEKYIFEYFDYLSWVKSKLQNRPYAEIIREKYGNQDSAG